MVELVGGPLDLAEEVLRTETIQGVAEQMPFTPICAASSAWVTSTLPFFCPTTEWVDWFTSQRLQTVIGTISPHDYETNH